MKEDKFTPIKAPKRTPRPAPEPTDNATLDDVRAAREVIRRLLLEMRSKQQGGYSSRHNGKWRFVSTSLPQTAPHELDKLFKFAGIVPDEIEIVGECGDCANSNDGRERGYSSPCGACLRPSHINNFVPRDGLAKGKKR